MLFGTIGGLLSGWILSLFGFIELVQGAMLELFNMPITSTSYYFIFALVGFIVGAIRAIRG